MIASRTTGGVVAVEIATGGSGYVLPPGVSFSGGAGTGAAGIATLVNGQVQGVVITNAGTGYTSAPTVSFKAATGSGAGATASVYTGPLRPMSFFQGRSGEVFGVDGMGRGIRIDCAATQATPIGIAHPDPPPTVAAATTSGNSYVASIHLSRPGAGYNATPTVTLSGGTPTTAAEARAIMLEGRLAGVEVVNPGSGYQAAPAVQFTGGFPSGESFGIKVSGGVARVEVTDHGSGYDPAVDPVGILFSTAEGLTQACALAVIDSLERISDVAVLSSGTGATVAGVTAVALGGGVGLLDFNQAKLAVEMRYSITHVTVSNGGANHQIPPVLVAQPDPADLEGGGAAFDVSVSGGKITGVKVLSGGAYRLPPIALVPDTRAEAVAVLSTAMVGRYLCATRFVDRNKVASSISELVEVNASSGSGSLAWTLSHANVDSRVTDVELWRTSADQSIVLYRVATLPIATTTYTDTLSDPALTDPERAGFGLMPITLPSGQLNARRFGVPPGNYGVAVLFQDRAWFAVDTTGRSPNSLLYSEVDEPESVPEENELILQENAGEHDTIIGLVPMGSELLVVQTGHLYSLRYVAQPVIDASLTLVAYRGALNSACYTVMGGVAFLVDSYGVYAFDGRNERALSAAVDDFWQTGRIDFTKAAKFHMSQDYKTKVVRFHYCGPNDAEPVRALCFCVATEAWWEEEYPLAVTASAPVVVAGQRGTAMAVPGGFRRFRPGADAEGDVAWQYRSGNYTLTDGPARSAGVLYRPTVTSCNLSLSLAYNGSTAARTMPVVADRGTGFVNIAGSTSAVIDMAATRSPLGPATGYAEALFSGRLDTRSAGSDRHVAIQFAGTRGADPVVLHAVTLQGAT